MHQVGQLERDVGVCQLPCPEQHAWGGGVLKRRMLIAYGSAGLLRAPVARLLPRPFLCYSQLVYARLTRAVAREVAACKRSGVEVVGLVGIGGSPSCGIRNTLDMPAAVGALSPGGHQRLAAGTRPARRTGRPRGDRM